MSSYQDTTTTIIPVVQRTPVELWRMILSIAVESPMIPRNDDDVLDAFRMFCSDCESQSRQRRAEANRITLRLVCQAWNAILKEMGISIYFIDHGSLKSIRFKQGGPQKVRRIESIHGEVPPGCPSSCPPLHSMDIVKSDVLKHVEWLEYLQVSHRLTPLVPEGKHTLHLEILDKAPRLRALILNLAYLNQDKIRQLLKHSSLTRLTHLSIGPVGQRSALPLPTPLSFPKLHSLVLYISSRGIGPINDEVLECGFPSLTSLIIQRSKSQHGSPLMGLERFLGAHGKNITSLKIEYLRDLDLSSDYHINDQFWTWFPRLRLFGPGLHALTSNPTSPSHSLDSLMIEASYGPGDEAGLYTFDTYVEPVLNVCREWGVKVIIMLSTWEEMAVGPVKVIGDGIHLSSSPWSKRLFEYALELGIRILDADRVPITSKEGVLFLEALRGADEQAGSSSGYA